MTPSKQFTAILFDVQGTLTDFWSTMLDHGRDVLGDRIETLDWPSMVNEWRAAYRSEVADLSSAQEWRSVRSIYATALADIVRGRGLDNLITGPEILLLTDGWERLRPWPDAAEGLKRLWRSHLVAALSNADFSSVVTTSRVSGFDWDAVFSAQLFRAFRPHESTYLGAAGLLGVDPERILMVASHRYDLDAAAALSLGTAFVHRPHEYGPDGRADTAPDGEYLFSVQSIEELAVLLES